MSTPSYNPRLYVGTYAKYNDGNLAGKWLDLGDYGDREEFLEACAALHDDERDPEFMFQDFEGFPKEFYNESSVSNELFEWVALDDGDREAVVRYADAFGYGYASDNTVEQARDAFHGTASSEADFAQELAEELGEVPDDFPSWIVIDWKASWDCNLRHDYTTSTDAEGDIWFFHNS